jgi:hypothetical protein
MAQRLATEYVNTCLVLGESELRQLFKQFQISNLPFKVKVLDNGDHEVIFEESSAIRSVLRFSRRRGKYVLQADCRFSNIDVADAIRKAISTFKGDATVRRIYAYYTLEYVYRNGSVVKIKECTPQAERLIYENQETCDSLTKIFQNQSVAIQIRMTRQQIDHLLDERNRSTQTEQVARIDHQLQQLTHQLFIFEA